MDTTPERPPALSADPSPRPGRSPAAMRGKVLPCLLRALVLALALALWPAADASPSQPEKPYALIYGTVWGPNKLPAYGVKVRIRRAEEKKARWELYSDHQGEFAQRVPAGPADYVVWAEVKPDKRSKPRKNNGLDKVPEVTVHIQNDERADISLHLTE